MPTYIFECARHGRKEVARPMAQAGEPEFCWPCLREEVESGRHDPFADFPLEVIRAKRMRRVWSVPSLIVRPHNFHLKPEEPGYWDIDRTMEVSRIPTPDERSNLGAGAPSDEELDADEYAGIPFPQPSEDGMQKLYEVARATFSESGSRL
jgi:hypothetical protein